MLLSFEARWLPDRFNFRLGLGVSGSDFADNRTTKTVDDRIVCLLDNVRSSMRHSIPKVTFFANLCHDLEIFNLVKVSNVNISKTIT